MVTVLSQNRAVWISNAKVLDDELWVPVDRLEEATGWAIKPDGLCQGEVCVPLPMNGPEPLLRDGDFNVSAFWHHIARPVARDAQGGTWFLGDSTDNLRSRLTSLKAPDITLPDMEGDMHSLRDYQGTKVFMVAWASW